MRDNFEDFITKNKYNFDRVEPIPIDDMWHSIEGELAPRKRFLNSSWKRIAAAVITVAIAVPFGLEQLTGPMETVSSMQTVGEVYPAWQPEEDKYMHLISSKKKEIGFDTLGKEKFPELHDQLSHMEVDFMQSLKDLQSYGDKEAILKVLVKYHERQLNILEKIAREAEKEKRYVKPYEERIY